MTGIRSVVRNSSILVRLMASFGALALITGLVGGIGMWAFSRINHSFDSMLSTSVPALVNLMEADRELERVVVAERTLLFM